MRIDNCNVRVFVYRYFQAGSGDFEYLNEDDAHALVGSYICCRRDWIRPVRAEIDFVSPFFSTDEPDAGSGQSKPNQAANVQQPKKPASGPKGVVDASSKPRQGGANSDDSQSKGNGGSQSSGDKSLTNQTTTAKPSSAKPSTAASQSKPTAAPAKRKRDEGVSKDSASSGASLPPARKMATNSTTRSAGTISSTSASASASASASSAQAKETAKPKPKPKRKTNPNEVGASGLELLVELPRRRTRRRSVLVC